MQASRENLWVVAAAAGGHAGGAAYGAMLWRGWDLLPWSWVGEPRWGCWWVILQVVCAEHGGRDTLRCCCALLQGAEQAAASRRLLMCTRHGGRARRVEAAACRHRAEQAAASRLRLVRTRRCGLARHVEDRCLWAPAGGKREPRLLRRGCCLYARGAVDGRDTLRLLRCAPAGIERSRWWRRGCCSLHAARWAGEHVEAPACGRQQVANAS